ncbi:WbqC family protein [Streptomyces sp. NPDC051582]|uniref:WbqC family protein n=1 Tax=Streptomyces sp. NPDC051582 TaxID=3155167 RepID=UPI0034498D94
MAVHQPGYHRHLYYFYKMATADLFVSLDHVQFVRSDWQNRQVFVHDGVRRWLTVPVRGGRVAIRRKVLADPSALASHWDRITSIYRGTPYFGDYERALGEIYASSWTHLNDLCDALTEVARTGFGITTPYLRASRLMDEPGEAKGALLADVVHRAADTAVPAGPQVPLTYLACSHPMGQDHYLRRPSGQDPARAEHEVMEGRGVRVRTFGFRHPRYAQTQLAPGTPFQAELSAYDLLFNHGPEARDILLGAGAGAGSRSDADERERPRLYRIGGK